MYVNAERLHPARTDGVCEWYSHRYASPEGLARVERRSTEAESDFLSEIWERRSPDNGRSFGEWTSLTAQSVRQVGRHEWERLPVATVWNPVHGHYAELSLERVYTDGHARAYERWWGRGEPAFSDHSLLRVFSGEGDEGATRLIAYEEGAAAFDPEDPVAPGYYDKNVSYCGTNIEVDPTGDILIPLGVPVAKCCERMGQSADEIFPSCPLIMKGLMLARGVWNGGEYVFSFSRPAVISDLFSSRGVDEPTVARLASGRIVIVFRGSNARSENWNTRIEPGAPGVKWRVFSDDGGKTLSPPAPWHFDDGEIIYSSASISFFLQNSRSGRHYWLGNATGHAVSGNHPRWPLCLVCVDETYGTAEKATLTLLDTQRKGESDRVQLSNFSFIENRETGRLEVYVTKLGQFEGRPWQEGEAWRYEIDWT